MQVPLNVIRCEDTCASRYVVRHRGREISHD